MRRLLSLTLFSTNVPVVILCGYQCTRARPPGPVLRTSYKGERESLETNVGHENWI